MKIRHTVRLLVAIVCGGIALSAVAERARAGQMRAQAVAYSSSWKSKRTSARHAFDGKSRTKWCPRAGAVGSWVSITLDTPISVAGVLVTTTVGMTLEVKVDGRSAGVFTTTHNKLETDSMQAPGDTITFHIRRVLGRGRACIKEIAILGNHEESSMGQFSVTPKLSRASWGAFAANRHTGRWTYKINQASKRVASRAALRTCGRGCEVIVAFKQKCAAIVRVGTHIYFGHGKSRAQAERNASKFCARGTRSMQCSRVTAWACTNQPM